MINDAGFAPAWADSLQNTAKLPRSACRGDSPTADEGQAKLETSQGVSAPAEQALRLLKVNPEGKEQQAEVTAGTKPFHLLDAKWPMASFT